MTMCATESIVQQTLRHQLFHCWSLFFVSDFPFVLVSLVDEVPEDVIKLLHVFCTITFADVADPGLHTPSFGVTCFSDRIS